MIIKKFEDQTKKFPQKTAVITGSSALTYHQLNQCANRVARTILKIKPENEKKQIAGLLFEHSTQMIVGVIGALKAGKIYLPLDITYPENRLVYMLEDSEAQLVLTNNNNLPLAEKLVGKVKNDITVINVDTIKHDRHLSGENIQRNSTGDKPVYILYTSGSTGRPKGVLQNHENVCYYTGHWTHRFSITSSDRMTLFSAFSHDAAVWDIFGALLNGAALYPYNILKANILQLSEWLIRERISIWHSVPTFFRYFVNTLNDPDTGKTHFPHLRFILLGGEQIRHHDIEMFERFFPNSLLVNIYGQTEASVNSLWFVKPGDSIDKILIGDPVDNTKIFIADKSGAVVEKVGVGEIIVASKHIAPGYWKDKENNKNKFFHHPDLGRLYRTGDLGHLMADGSIEFMSRKDFQVKIRGHRVEMGEIETTLLNHDSITEAVVTAKTDENGNICLCAYYVPDPLASNRGSLLPLTVTGLREYLSRELPEYMIPSYFTQLEHLPLTPNGKVDRKNLPEPEPLQSRVSDTYTAPSTILEKKISNTWKEILNLHRLGIHDNFFELGGDSLKAMTCVGRIHKEFNTEIPLREIFNNPTIRELAQYIEKNSQIGKFHSIKPAEQKEYYEVSAAQKRLYFLQQLEPSSTGYNLTFTVLLEGDIDREKFDQTFRKLINRHEILRTSFEMAVEKPVQRIHDKINVEIEYSYTERNVQSTESKEERHAPCAVRYARTLKNFIRPFDLGQSPFMRVGLINTTGKTTCVRHIFMLDIHHIIFDGMSINILFKELMDLYRGRELPTLQVQYKDYCEWQNRQEDQEVKKRQEDYWMDVFAGVIPVINLPLDHPRPPVQSFEGNRLRFVIGKKETDVLKAVAKEEEVTLFMVLLAVINVLLMKLTGQEDIIIGTPVSGRSHPDSEKIVGMFINTLALRNNPANQKIFREFLGEIKERTLNDFENHDYPFEDLVEKVEIRRDVSRNPLFDVMFILHNYASPARGIQELEIEGLKLKPYAADSNTSMFDMTFSGVEFDESLLFSVEYCTKLFKKETIERFTGYFQKVISSYQEVLEKKLSDIDILPGEEKNQLLHQFNNTDTQYPKDKTVHELFQEQAERIPDHIALVGSHEKIEGTRGLAPLPTTISITYRELNENSNRLAFQLKEKGVKPGTITAIMVKRSIRMMIGLLGILKAGGTYLPLDPEFPGKRINYILGNSNTEALVVDDTSCAAWLSFAPKSLLNLSEGHYLNFPASQLPGFPAYLPSSPPYVIYTSGSTGNPKGVMVRHKSAVNFIKGMTSVIDFLPDKSILALTTISFDIFFLETLLPVTRGMKVIIADEAQQKDPQLLKEVIISHNVNMLQLTPSRLQLLLSFKDDLQYLSSVDELIVGGEAFPVHLFEQVREKYTGNIYNVYGPTETTIWSTVKDLSNTKTGGLTIGTPIANTQIYIVDKHMGIQPQGIAGELLIGGDGVASGYLNNPELTAEKFINYKLQNTNCKPNDIHAIMQPGNHATRQCHSHPPITPLPHYPIYLTGDLSRWLTNGEIEFLDRIDHQVKIRGFRIEVEEIEEQLMKHENIKEAVVTAMGNEQSDKYLAAYLVPGPVMEGNELDVSHLREFLQQQLPDYMIPSYFVRLVQIPLTPNGKVDRKRLPEPETAGVEGSSIYQEPRNLVEKKLADIWSEVLRIKKNTIAIDDNFFEQGGHSLRAIIMITKIHKEFDIMLLLADIFKAPTIRGISACLEDSVKEKYAAIEPAEAKDYYPVSSAQKRLYILHQLDPHSLGYNLPGVFVVEGHIDERRLQNTIRQLLERHENLRTSFKLEEGEPVQKIHESVKVEFSIEYYQTSEEIHHSFIRPFDLSRAPLLRVGLIKDKKNGHLLLFDMHHIITDGTSQNLLVKEFTALYSGQDLSRLRLQYKDYAGWQNSTRQRRLLEHQKSYWRELFPDAPPVLNLPFDYPRPAIQSFEGSTVGFRLTAEELKGLKSLAKETEATLFMSILALFNVLLSKLSGQEDIVIGTPAAARRHADLEHIIGIFINTLAMRNYPLGHKTFKGFLREVKKHALEAYENQEYPFEDLVEQVVVNRDLSRNPLFDAMFIMHNELQLRPGAIPEPAKKDLKLKSYEYKKRTSQFDLTLVGFEGENHLLFKIEYCTKLFKEESIRRFILYFNEIVSLVLKNPQIKLSEIGIISREEKNQILYNFNKTGITYPKDKILHELFEEQVERTPDYVALVGVRETHETHEKNYNMSYLSHISYKELNEKADQLAFKLKEKGVKPGTITAIMVKRTIRMMVGLLGILKSGCTYLPLDPEYPGMRINYILGNSNSEVLVTTPQIQAKINAEASEGVVHPQWKSIKIFNIGQDYVNFSRTISSTSTCRVSPASPAYVIYTSGSTGNPKGVMVQHLNVVNFIKGMTFVINFLPGKSILALTTISFDIFFLETLLPVTRGMKVVIADEIQQKDPQLLEKIILHQKVNMLQLTPSRLQLLLSFKDNLHYLSSAAELIVGGEVFPVHLFKQIREHYAGKIYNVYGPTETTIWSTIKDLTRCKTGELTIGSPIANTQVYIVDKHTRIQPLGIVGELLIGGDGVATGYLNNVELTVERFLNGPPITRINPDEINQKLLRGVQGGGFLEKSPPGRRRPKLYKTGDLARWLPKGEIEFLGRVDHQVKIRGFRVELDEIEEQLVNHQDIKEAVVVTKVNRNNDKYLTAYIVPMNTSKEKDLDIESLTRYLARELPYYMIPSHVVPLENIPLTPNGKIQRSALPEPGESRLKTGMTYVEPITEEEKIIAGIWKEVLGLETIGINDNFFNLGGNSLDVVRVNQRLRETFSRNIPVVEQFRYLTVAALTRYLVREEEAVPGRERSKILNRAEQDKRKRFQMRKRRV